MNEQETSRGLVALGIGATFIFTIALMATTVVAGDNSYQRVVKDLRFQYGATEDNFYGAGLMGELAVALIRPAGVSNMTFTILRGLDEFRKSDLDFNQIVRSAVEPKWRPLVMYSSAGEREWTHVYAQPDGSHIKVLVVTRTRSDAVVVQARIDPDRLSAFIDDPKILGVPVGNRASR